jgi:hypothetical protein
MSQVDNYGQDRRVDEKHGCEVLGKSVIVDDGVLMMFFGWMVNVFF